MNWLRLISGFLLSFVFLLFFAYVISGAQHIMQNSPPVTSTNSASISGAVQNLQTPPAPAIDAEAAISQESDLVTPSKTLFEKNSDEKLPIASLTKLMTAIVVLDNYKLSGTITIDKDADSQDPLKQDVKLGDTLPVESLLDIMLVESSNKSAYALSELMGESDFVGMMNKKASEIGLEKTFFTDPTGLSSQNVSTATDLTKLAEYILKNYTKITDISSAKSFYVPGYGEITSTNELLGQVPEIVCGKTGFTNQAKGCLLVVINNPKNNDYIINVILGAKSADDRFSEMKKIINWSNQTCK